MFAPYPAGVRPAPAAVLDRGSARLPPSISKRAGSLQKTQKCKTNRGVDPSKSIGTSLAPGAKHRSNPCGNSKHAIEFTFPASYESPASATKNTKMQNKPRRKSGCHRAPCRVLVDEEFQLPREGTIAPRNQGRQLVKYGCGFSVSIPIFVDLRGFQPTPRFPSSSRTKTSPAGWTTLTKFVRR